MKWSLDTAVLVFAVGGLAVAVLGWLFTGIVDRLADRTGLGEAVAGGVLLGATTSLPDTVVTITAAIDGQPELAVTNALGGIALQTVFLVVADLTYRRANLEHAAASMPNLVYGVLLVTLLLIPLLANAAPDVTLLGVHPVSPVILALYWSGVKLVHRSHERPMWFPRRTRNTREDEAEPPDEDERVAGMWAKCALIAPALAVCGWALATAAQSIIAATGLATAFVGGVFTAGVTSLPELVVSISAVRRGALVLAVGNVIGGNAFDALQLPLADLAYRGEESIYGAFGDGSRYLAALTAVMTVALLAGLLRRHERGIANIGFEGWAILLLYAGGMTILYWM